MRVSIQITFPCLFFWIAIRDYDAARDLFWTGVEVAWGATADACMGLRSARRLTLWSATREAQRKKRGEDSGRGGRGNEAR